MKFRAIEESEWRGCQYLREGAEAVRRSAQILLSALRESFIESYAKESFGIEFTWETEDVVAVTTPAASGRMRLVWDATSQGLIGRYVIERKDVAPDDSIAWTPVWALLITAGRYGGTDDHFAFGDDLTKRFTIGQLPGPRGREGVFTAGMSIAYALNSRMNFASE